MRNTYNPVALLVIPFWCFATLSAYGQEISASNNCFALAATAKVTAVYAGSHNAKRVPTGDQIEDARLGDTITLIIDRLNELLTAEENCKERNGGSLVLFIDGRPVPDATAYPPLDPRKNALQFVLGMSDSSAKLWTHVLGRPKGLDREVEISVGLANSYAIPSGVRINIVVLPRARLMAWGAVFFSFLLAFVVIARKTDVLRARTPLPSSGRRPYSLAMFQASWWFFIVFGSYIFLLIVTRDYGSSISGASVFILAIAAGTAAGSVFIDVNKETPATQQEIISAEKAIDQRLDELAIQMEEIKKHSEAQSGERASLLAAEESELKRRKSKARRNSLSFLADILSDAHGVSFHRFQLLAWMFVFGIIFLYEVWQTLDMPNFSNEILGLMGVSSGTFLGLKIPEPHVPVKPSGK